MVAITESWSTNNILNSELHLYGYQMFRRDRNTDNRGEGVFLYARDSVKATEVHLESGFGETFCVRLVSYLLVLSTGLQIVGQDSHKNLLELLTKVSDKQVLILGDFNYPDIDWCTYTVSAAASRDCCEFINTIEDCFYTEHVLCPTRDNAIFGFSFVKRTRFSQSAAGYQQSW